MIVVEKHFIRLLAAALSVMTALVIVGCSLELNPAPSTLATRQAGAEVPTITITSPENELSSVPFGGIGITKVTFDTNVADEIKSGVLSVRWHENSDTPLGTKNDTNFIPFVLGYGEHLLTIVLVDAQGEALLNPEARDSVTVYVSAYCEQNSQCSDEGFFCNQGACLPTGMGPDECKFGPAPWGNCCQHNYECDLGKVCNIASHTCVECLDDADCDDGDSKTVNLCQQQTCIAYGCITAADCDDDNPATTDKCVQTECENLTCGPGGCCKKNLHCNDDGNTCTLEFCDNNNPEYNGGNCDFTIAKPCTVGLPLIEEWDDLKDAPGGITFRGWEVWSNPANTGVINEYNWQITDKGPLGPDLHMRFRWAPVAKNYSGCLITPRIDSFYWNGAEVVKQEDYMTMQFEHSGRVLDGSATVDIFAYEAPDGATTPPTNFNTVDAMGWRWSPVKSFTFDEDFDRQFVTWSLDGEPHYESEVTRYAFCVGGDYTYSIYDWNLDSIRLHYGLPPYWGGSGYPTPPRLGLCCRGPKERV